MNVSTPTTLLGVFALTFLLLLFAKVLRQAAEDRVAKQLLMLLLVGLFSMAYCLFYIYAGMARHWPRLANVEVGFTWFIGPSLYFYVRRLNGGPSPFKQPLQLLHWLPAVLIELVLLPYFLMSSPEKAAYLAQRSGGYLYVILLVWAGFHVQLLSYILLSQPWLRRYRRGLAGNPSDASRTNVRWLQLLCYGLVAQITLEWTLHTLQTERGLSNAAGMAAYLFIIALAYSALGNTRLQLGSAEPRAHGNGKYQRSALRDDSAEYYLDKLTRLMAADRCYLQGDLSLNSLAERLRMSPHHLSQLLNEKLHKSFYDYVNEQRVAYAKDRLVSEPLRPITEIAFESGYNSRNSFYNSFKRYTGMMPAEYRRTHAS